MSSINSTWFVVMVRFWLVRGVVTGTTAVSVETAVASDLKIQHSSGRMRGTLYGYAIV